MRIRAYLAFLVSLIAAGCGGGGSAGSSGDTIVTTVTIPVGQGLQTTFGSAVLNFGINNSGQPNVLQLSSTAAPHPPNSNQVYAGQRALTIQATTDPGPFTVSYPDTIGIHAVGFILKNGQAIGAYPAQPENGRMVINADPAYLPSNTMKTRSSSWIVTISLGLLVRYTPPDHTVGLLPVGSVNNKSSVLLWCHGLFQNAESSLPTVQALLQQGGQTAGYSLKYDWRVGFDEVATTLAPQLAQFNSKSVDVVGYSKGGLVARWLMIKENITDPIRRTMFLGTPNYGCAWTHELLFSVLLSRFYNDPTAIGPIFDPNDSCLAELMPTSLKLFDLNYPTARQYGNVDCLYVGGDKLMNGDSIVGLNSARFEGDAASQLTNGRVFRLTLNGASHFDLDEPGPVAQAFTQLPNELSGVDVSIVNNPCEASTSTGSWRYSIYITNHTGQDIILDSDQYEGFSRYGNWTGNFWYNPELAPGEFFPTQPYQWNQPLARDQTLGPIQVESWADLDRTPVQNAPADRQAGAVNWILLAHGVDGRYYENRTVLRLTFNGAIPEDPHTRSAHGLPTAGTTGVGRPTH